MRAAIRFATWLAVCSCASEATSAAPDVIAVTFEIGGAADDGSGFVPWNDREQHVNMIMGPQGGQHVWLNVRTSKQVTPQKMHLDIDLKDLETGLTVVPMPVVFTPTLVDGGAYWQTDKPLTAWVKEPCKIKGHHVQLTVSGHDLWMTDLGIARATFIAEWSGFCSAP